MRKFITIGVAFLMFFLQLNLCAEYDLFVHDPLQTYDNGGGNIENIAFALTPKGIYTQVELTMEIREAGAINSNANLEIVFDFELPKDAFITDSWLWVEDEIVRGEMWDRWSATQFYESFIFEIQEDPSVLYKNSETDYQLRIYPVLAGESRKIKITYMVPTDWSSDEVSLSLPMEILNTSATPVTSFELYTYLDDEKWRNQRIAEQANVNFTKNNSPTHGEFYYTEVPVTPSLNKCVYTLDAPYKDGVFANFYNNGGESFYEVVVLPENIVSEEVSRKRIAILINYNASNSDITKLELLNMTRAQLEKELDVNDYFNVAFGNQQSDFVRDDWIPMSLIDEVFNEIVASDEMDLNTGNLEGVINSGVEFVNSNEYQGSIILLTNVTDYYYQNEVDLIHEYVESVVPHIGDIHFSIVNFQDQNYVYMGLEGGLDSNGFTYTNITDENLGEYLHCSPDMPFEMAFSNMLNQDFIDFGYLDIECSLENGFAYDRFEIDKQLSPNLNKPFMQTGKYVGDFPFIVNLVGFYDDNILTELRTIESENIYSKMDSTIEECWMANHIQELEKLPSTYENVEHIIELSKEERVLSLYTTLICVEPDFGGEVCEECHDNPEGFSADVANGIDDLSEETDIKIKTFPNPFVEFITIEFDGQLDIISIQIFDATGKLIKEISLEELLDNKYLWDGTDDVGAKVGAGMYFVKIATEEGVIVQKVLKN